MNNNTQTIVLENTTPAAIHIAADTLPECWEAAVVAVWNHGTEIATQYDKPEDPPSRDATATLTIRNPLQEPRIHRAFPGGIEDLEVYRQEVVDGIHDSWIDPEHGKWEYTYHERLFDYRVPKDYSKGVVVGPYMLGQMTAKTKVVNIDYYDHVNQMDYVVNTLAEAPHSRRAQAITWQPWQDCGIFDPSCLQSLWFRVFDDKLAMNIRMRSNDLFKATFMNLFAFIDLQRLVAERLTERLGRTIHQGQVVHMVDSLHLYGSYNEEIKGFLKTLEARTFEQRTFNSNDEMIQEMFAEAKDKIKKSIEQEKETGRKGL